MACPPLREVFVSRAPSRVSEGGAERSTKPVWKEALGRFSFMSSGKDWAVQVLPSKHSLGGYGEPVLSMMFPADIDTGNADDPRWTWGPWRICSIGIRTREARDMSGNEKGEALQSWHVPDQLVKDALVALDDAMEKGLVQELR